jgi:hypothetical protein
MTVLWNFLKALPALFKLFETIQKRIDEAGVDRKVVDDIKLVHDAFQNADAKTLNDLFNS